MSLSVCCPALPTNFLFISQLCPCLCAVLHCQLTSCLYHSCVLVCVAEMSYCKLLAHCFQQFSISNYLLSLCLCMTVGVCNDIVALCGQLCTPVPNPGDERAEFDFQAMRLDWFRLQVLTSVNKAALRWVCSG